MLNCETLLHNEVYPVITGKKGMKSVVYVCAPGKQMFHPSYTNSKNGMICHYMRQNFNLESVVSLISVYDGITIKVPAQLYY